MAKFIHSIMAHNETITADTVITYDLPVNPLSFILVTIDLDQNLANVPLVFANIPAMISRIEVLHKQSAIFSMNGLDMLACGLFINGFESWGVNAYGNDNDVRAFTFLVPLGRKMYDPREAFPRTTRGELQLQITYQAAFVEIDAAAAQIETLEMPEANPERFLKMTTLAKTPAATGEFDVDLPIGNPISDLVLFGTTIPCADAVITTIDQVRILVDNIETFYARTNFETLHNLSGRKRAAPGYWGSHVHRLTEAAFAQYDDTGVNIPQDHILSNHLHMPFDIWQDGQYMLETAGKSDVTCRITAGDTNPVRVIPCELVGV